jgi:Protein of unknown function (DUF2809)
MNAQGHGEGGVSSDKLRLIYAALAVIVIAAGLLWRWPGLHLPPVLAKYGGSVLWGALVYMALRVLLPRISVKTMAALAAVLAAFVEFTQLLHWPWLEAFRSTPFGVLLIGRFFSWWDIASYWLGIAAAGAGDHLCRERDS